MYRHKPSFVHLFVFIAAAMALAQSGAAWGDQPVDGHGIAMHGVPKYAPDFSHFDYAHPDAPKGGALRRARVGSFDSLNPFIVRGVPAQGLKLVYESLMARAMDEPFSLYGLLAKSVAVPPGRGWVEIRARRTRAFSRWLSGHR